MRRTVLALAGALLALLPLAEPASAKGIDGEVSVELGTLANDDDAYDLFGEGGAMPSRGLRLGGNVTENLVVVGGWHRVRRGAEVGLGDEETQSFTAAFFADEFTIGPKAQYSFGDIFLPYVATQALFFRGVMKLDDDPSTKSNPGQVQASAFSPGVLAVAGAELRTGTKRREIAAAYFIEAGYGYVARGTYGELGTMKPGGFALRSGVGVRF